MPKSAEMMLKPFEVAEKDYTQGAGGTMKRYTLAVLLILGTSEIGLGQASVVPTDRVVNVVNIRASATTGSTKLGILLPGESAAFIGELPNWYRIDHPEHGTGFVSKSWTRVVTDADTILNNTFDFMSSMWPLDLQFLCRDHVKSHYSG